MQPRQMADNFFGFDTSLGAGLDDGLDCLDDEEYGEENNYDALNDETFGSEATAGDWEQDHEKLAQITESSRPRLQNDYSKSESEIDVENSLSHLVLDEKEVTIPRPGVWDSPTNFPIAPPQIRPKPSLTSALKNACTVEELERGLITSRPPPGLIKQPTASQPSSTSGGNLFLNSIVSVDISQQINGVAPPPNQFPLVLPSNVRLAHPQFHLQNVRPMANQPGNMLRYPLPPHLLMPGGQRQPPVHGNFPMNNYPHPSNPGMGPLPFMRQDHPLILQNMQQQHQMHVGNQRNQNKQFNHKDRQDNHHQPFFRNNQYNYLNMKNIHKYLINPGHHGHHMHPHLTNHHQNYMSSNGVSPSEEQDEYAGLMNNREKQWLNNIQLLQLNTNQPYFDDYYYTVFCDKNKNILRKAAIGKKPTNGKNNGNNNSSNGHRDSRDRDQPQHTFTPKPGNTPMQFENSLGKLQYSSVTAPRKIIDMDVVPNSDPQQATSLQQKDTKKTRQLLLEIERLYMLLLKLEDTNNPLAILANQQREQQQREQQQQESGEVIPEPVHPLIQNQELTVSIVTSLLQLAQEDKLASFLSIRKGKMLFLRFLESAVVDEIPDKLEILWVGIIKGLPIIARRDSHLFEDFSKEFNRWVVHNKPYKLWVPRLVKEFLEPASQPSKSNTLTFALSNKFGISVIGLMIDTVTREYILPEYTMDDQDWQHWPRFLRSVGEALSSSSSIVDPFWKIWSTHKEQFDKHLAQNDIDSSYFAAFKIFFYSR
ncbi:protein PAT1 homolog 1 isoform X1 [Nasonia vitripennis]|uniref:mRNA decay factor PAT1 domain-containing protein n=1 Tax=Nasonia vitripennis TaxID=7425 RepID=A0A7M7PUP9_NASVI|nr:protein PAT1 homolog 1 isoform X1 [Nasonia vitripennis]